MKWVQPKFTPSGQLIVDPMVGTYEDKPVGSLRWAEAMACHIQHSHERMVERGNPNYLCKVIKDALTAAPPPWEVYPEEAKGDPEAWMRMVTLASWGEIEAAVKGRDPEAWREIEGHLAQWEAKHRTKAEAAAERDRDEQGRFAQTPVSLASGVARDDESARGIRRRLVKRAQAGDAQAAELVEQLKAGLSVNQAAIAAGMRQEYMRIRKDDPAKAAASLLAKMGPDWCHRLAVTLATLS